MYNASSAFFTAIRQHDRVMKAKVVMRRTGFLDVTYDDTQIISMSRTAANLSGQYFEIGDVVSAQFQLTLKNLDFSLSSVQFNGAALYPSIGAVLADGSVEYVPLGVYYVDVPEKPEGSIVLPCYDGIVNLDVLYNSTLAYPATLLQIAQEIASLGGLTLTTTSFPNASVSIPAAPSLVGTTLRQALAWVAEAAGCFAVCDRNGDLDIRWYTASSEAISPANYYTLQWGDGVIPAYDGVEIEVASGRMDGPSQGTCKNPYQIVANPLLSQVQSDNSIEYVSSALPALYTQLNGFSFMPFEAEWSADPALDVGDIITVTDRTGATYTTYVMSDALSYDGGLKSTTQAIGLDDTQSQDGSLTAAVNKVVTDQQEITNLMSTNFTAVNANIQNLTTGKLDATTAALTYATASQLNVTNENVTTITGQIAQFTVATGDSWSVNKLAAGTINAGDGVIANGAIGDALISDVKAGKITSGTVNTTNVSIASSSGNFVLQDNTIQITDGTHARVQIGKDGTGDYNLYLWNAAGTLLWNAAGILPGGIPNGTIRDDMVAGDASINATKIDQESLITRINGASSYIQASKIYYDSTSQTLDVAFQNLSTTVNTASTNASSAVTTANTAASNASSAVSTANSASSTASTAASNASTALSTANTASTNASSAVSTANSASSTASSALSTANSAQSSVTALSQTVTSQGTSLSVVQGQINSKVWETDITTAVNAVQVGGTNLLTNSGLSNGTSGWGISSTGAVDSSVQFRGSNSVKINVTNATSDWNGEINDFSYSVILPNTTYTASIWVYCNDITTITSGFYLMARDASTAYTYASVSAIPSSNQVWQRITATFTTLASVSSQLRVFATIQRNGTVWIACPKLELGNKATDWSPAPQDVQTQINTMSTSISQNATAISLKASLNDVTNMLNVSTSGVQITAANIDINGLITQLNTKALYAQRISTTGSSVYGTIGDISSDGKTGFVLRKTSDNTNLLRIASGPYGDDGTNATIVDVNGPLTITSDLVSSTGASLFLYDELMVQCAKNASMPGTGGSSLALDYESFSVRLQHGYGGLQTVTYWLQQLPNGYLFTNNAGIIPVVNPNGVMGVGTYVDLHINGNTPNDIYDARLHVWQQGDGTSGLSLQSNGVFIRNTADNGYTNIAAASFNNVSLEEYKQDIEPLNSARDIVESDATIYAYRLRDEVARGIDHTHRGFVIGAGYATPREVLSADGCAVDQYAMTAVLWRATQEISADTRMQIESLQAQINALQGMIADLYGKVA